MVHLWTNGDVDGNWNPQLDTAPNSFIGVAQDADDLTGMTDKRDVNHNTYDVPENLEVIISDFVSCYNNWRLQ